MQKENYELRLEVERLQKAVKAEKRKADQDIGVFETEISDLRGKYVSGVLAIKVSTRAASSECMPKSWWEHAHEHGKHIAHAHAYVHI